MSANYSRDSLDHQPSDFDDDDVDPLCLGCHVNAELDSDGYCADCNDEYDDL